MSGDITTLKNEEPGFHVLLSHENWQSCGFKLVEVKYR